jgi:hypothetical protein
MRVVNHVLALADAAVVATDSTWCHLCPVAACSVAATAHCQTAAQDLANAVAAQHRTLQQWQKDQLESLQLFGKHAYPAVAVGHASGATPLPSGIEPRLQAAMEIVCAPYAKALKRSHPLRPKVAAAAQLLTQVYLEVSLSSFGLTPEDLQVQLQRLHAPSILLLLCYLHDPVAATPACS